MSIFDELEDEKTQDEEQPSQEQAKQPETLPELEELKRKVAELEDAKKRLEQMLQEPPKPQPAEDPSLGLFQEVAVLKLERYLANDPVARQYRDEVVRVLQQLPDPKARATDAAIEAAIKYVKGSHLDELLKQAAPPPPPPPPPSDADGREPERKAPVVELSEQQKMVASLWFSGDLEAVKRNILGLEE